MWLFSWRLSTLRIVTALGTYIIFWPFFFFFFPFLVSCTFGNNPFSSSSEEGGKKEVGDLEVDVDKGERGYALLWGEKE